MYKRHNDDFKYFIHVSGVFQKFMVNKGVSSVLFLKFDTNPNYHKDNYIPHIFFNY